MSAAAKALDALLAAKPTAEKWTNEQRYVESCKQMLAVNLSAPLAAVARAAMAYRVAVVNGGVNAAEDALFAALDALEAAAAEGGAS